MTDKLADEGPWEVNVWPPKVGKERLPGPVVLQSHVFEHDVALEISGDFGSHEDKMAYAEALAHQLNAGTAALKEKGWTTKSRS